MPDSYLQFDKLQEFSRGKVRNTFVVDSRTLFPIATDKVSTHNVVHESVIPGKGIILTILTIFWITQILEKAGIPHHLVAYGRKIYDHLPGSRDDYSDMPDLHYRSLLIKKLGMIPIEFILRAYLEGSLWSKYQSKGLTNPYGIVLPWDLRRMHKFPEPIFTPTEKSENDDPLNSGEVKAKYPEATELHRKVFMLGTQHLNRVGIDLVDYKGECGLDEDGQVTMADEILTPDCARYTPSDEIALGKEPKWLDKEIVRKYVEGVWGTGAKVPLILSPEIIGKTVDTYHSIAERITGETVASFKSHYLD